MKSFGDMILRQMIREIIEMPKFRTMGDVIDAFKSISSGGEYNRAGYDARQRDRQESVAGNLKVASGPLRALMVGDSQLGSALGSEFEQKLRGLGYKVDKMSPINGGSPSQVTSALASNLRGHQLAVVFTGGNNATVGDSELAVDQMHARTQAEGAYLIAIGPPPATVATNLSALNQAFPDANGDLNYQMNRDGGRFAANRIDTADAIDAMNDPAEGLYTYGIASRHSVEDGTYEDQPDGLHCFTGAGEIVDDIAAEIDLAGLTTVIRESSTGIERNLPAPGDVTNSIRMSLTTQQRDMAALIEDRFQAAGYNSAAIMAAIVNAFAESSLNPLAKGDYPTDAAGNPIITEDPNSVGLFQLNINGAGHDMSIEARQDPEQNIARILEEAERQPEWQSAYSKTPDDPVALTEAWCRYVERPADKAGESVKRVGILRQMFDGV